MQELVLVKAVLALDGHSRHLQQLFYVLRESMTPKRSNQLLIGDEMSMTIMICQQSCRKFACYPLPLNKIHHL